jgi:hypothetical protein
MFAGYWLAHLWERICNRKPTVRGRCSSVQLPRGRRTASKFSLTAQEVKNHKQFLKTITKTSLNQYFKKMKKAHLFYTCVC